MSTENIIYSKINDIRNGTIDIINDKSSITVCEKYVTLQALKNYDDKIKQYINSKIKESLGTYDSPGYFKRVL